MHNDKNSLKRAVVFLLTLFSFSVLVIIVLFFLIVSDHAQVNDSYATPEDVKVAVSSYGDVSSELFSESTQFNVRLTESELHSIFKTASKAAPWLNADFSMAQGGMLVKGTLDLSHFLRSRYINISCLLIPDRHNSIDSCHIGNLYVPGNFAKWFANNVIKVFFDASISDVFLQSLNNITIESGVVSTQATKDGHFKQHSKDGLKAIVSTIKSFKNNTSYQLDYVIVSTYIDYILDDVDVRKHVNISLSSIFNAAFRLAKKRSSQSDPIKENEYAIWSAAIAFANVRFAELVKIDPEYLESQMKRASSINVVLGDRRDLALHFLYSTILERVGSETFSNNIGEIKELFDANHGGSGFDTSDLAADISGARFSYFVLSNRSNAIRSQVVLTQQETEDNFFPFIYSSYQAIDLKSIENSANLTNVGPHMKVVNDIKNAVINLPLYR
ncbi:hypothetical protein ACOMICROBIO_GDFFDHBD_04015 (plasmid) [Vibrio sp. B1REV9]|uniref:hypothetical protein n=1 Tax=Vibrio sp. B1REV9 TaxID=2751179 RepID=UPI001AECA615|nr:hypothetical protein [Vibrio sp. B1REV9]CAE6957228.1 hypothetical protein ACOMICROBIO_GDFFDHBD_04015 [Vibrio sp. B1REV9]